MISEPFHYSPITERPRLTWPAGASPSTSALNIETFLPDRPSTSIWPLDLIPDPLNHGWRDYGARVGIWRSTEILDRYGIRASALVNSKVAEHHPQIIEAGLDRDWAWLAHGKTNSVLHTPAEFSSSNLWDAGSWWVSMQTGRRAGGSDCWPEPPASGELVSSRSL